MINGIHEYDGHTKMLATSIRKLFKCAMVDQRPV